MADEDFSEEIFTSKELEKSEEERPDKIRHRYAFVALVCCAIIFLLGYAFWRNTDASQDKFSLLSELYSVLRGNFFERGDAEDVEIFDLRENNEEKTISKDDGAESAKNSEKREGALNKTKSTNGNNETAKKLTEALSVENEEDEPVVSLESTKEEVGFVLGAEEGDGEEDEEIFAPKCGYAASGISHKSVIINEIAWMGSEASANYEWIELKNISGKTVSLSGWELHDKDGQIAIVLPGTISLSPGNFLLLERNEEATDAASDVLYSGSLRNDEEGVELFDNECKPQDAAYANPKWEAGESSARKTMERDADGNGWHTSANAGGTPKKANSVLAVTPPPTTPSSSPATTTPNPPPPPPPPPPPAPPPPAPQAVTILISEIMPGTQSSSSDEFIELYNPSNFAVPLTGWYLKRKATPESASGNLISKSSGAFDGKSIPAKGFLLIGSNQYMQSKTPDARYSQNSTYMADNGDVLLLYDADDSLIDEVTYSEIATGKSWERRALSSGVCVSAVGEGASLGNGCDTGSFSDFELREAPEPQNAADGGDN